MGAGGVWNESKQKFHGNNIEYYYNKIQSDIIELKNSLSYINMEKTNESLKEINK